MADYIDREEAYWKIYNYMLTFVGQDAADNPTILDTFIAELRDEICGRIREIPAVNDDDLNRWIWGDLANERRKIEQRAALKADYISRDLALSFPFANGEYDHKNADPHFINGCESYREWLEQLPAADVAEVKHGRWVAESYYAGPLKMWGWKCTACEAFSPVNEVKFYKFCPNCGAKMDKEGD